MGIHIEMPNTDNSEIALCQKKAKEILFKLIGEKRESLNFQTTFSSTKWNQNDPDLIMKPQSIGLPTSTIYKLHSALALESVPEGYEEMYFHLQELRQIADG